MKRTEQATSPASSSKRSAASGSRSIPMNVPSAPRRPAISSAWPPPPNVQSIAVWPGRGSSRSISSPASTGMCVLLMSSRMVDTRGYLCDAAEQRRSMVIPAAPVPQLQAIAHPDDDDLLLQAGVLAEKAGDHDPSGGVELGVLRGAVEEALELVQPRRQRRQLRERALGVALVVLGAPDPDAGLQVDRHRDHHALGQRRAVAGRHREPVLRVEGVVEGAAERDHGAGSN